MTEPEPEVRPGPGIPDLSLVPDEVLRDEVLRRCDAGIILWWRRGGHDGRNAHFRAWRGPLFFVMGLCAEAAQFLGALHRKTQEPLPPDG